MNLIQRTDIQHKIENGYKFDIGKYITDGIELFKKDIGGFILAFLASMLFSFIPLVGAAMSNANFLRYAEKQDSSDYASIGKEIFSFEKLGSLILYLIISIVLIFICFTPFFLTGVGVGMLDPNGAEEMRAIGGLTIVFMYFLTFILFMLVYLACFYVVPLIVFGDYEVVEAIKTSFHLVKKQALMIFLFGIVVGLIIDLGLLACGVGILATIPIGLCINYMAYKDVLFSKSDDIEKIGAE